MKLNTDERINLLSICKFWLVNMQGDYVSLKVVNDFIDSIGFTQEEIDRLQFEVSLKGTSWNRKADRQKEVKVVNRIREIIKEELRKYDRAGQLNFLQHFNLCEKFGYQPEDKEILKER